MTTALPRWLDEMLSSPPRAGEGIHGWIFRVARHLHAHLPAVEIVRLLGSRLQGCGRHVPITEVTAAVQNSLGCAWQPSHGLSARPAPQAWPKINTERRGAILRDGLGLTDLWEASPVRLEDNNQHTEEIIDQLFPGDPLLCCGSSNSVFGTKPREAWRGQMADLQLIVPSPMSAPTGLTKDGKVSAHTLSNTAPRRFLVVEFDNGTSDAHAALLLHLAEYAPLVCVVHSGGKSLHGWFFVDGQPEEKVIKFFKYAVSIGADSRLWTRSQFCRMPDGTRDNGNRQTVFLLSLKPLGGASE